MDCRNKKDKKKQQLMTTEEVQPISRETRSAGILSSLVVKIRFAKEHKLRGRAI